MHDRIEIAINLGRNADIAIDEDGVVDDAVGGTADAVPPPPSA